jgi:hypothetical protein
MKKNSLFLLTSLAGMWLFFSSCQKNLDAVKADEVMGTPLPSSTDYCRIESIWLNPGLPDQQFRLIAYNEFENPTFITNPFIVTASPFRSFKYDSWHRLKEYLESYSNNNFETWHFYGFDLSGRIGVDTSYTFGSSITGKPTNYYYRTISTFTYDAQNRIISSANVITPDPTNPMVPPSSNLQTWTYNSAGNREGPGITYDNKVNLNRTNDIWMFLARDYSMNNPFTASSYNAAGYPTTINVPFARFILSNDIFLNNSQIGYGCRPSFYH